MARISNLLLCLGMLSSACVDREVASRERLQASCEPAIVLEGLDLPTMIAAGGGQVAYADASFTFEDADGLWVIRAGAGSVGRQLVDERVVTALEDRSVVRFTFDGPDLYHGWYQTPGDTHTEDLPPSLRRLNPDGSTDIIAEGYFPLEMAADASHVYFTEEVRPILFRAEKRPGGDVGVVARWDLPGFFSHGGVAVDDDFVYFFLRLQPFADDPPEPFAYGRIVRVPKAGGDLETIHEFFTRRAFAEEMKLQGGFLWVAARGDDGHADHFFRIDTRTLTAEDLDLPLEVTRFDLDDDFLYVPSPGGVAVFTHDGQRVTEVGAGRPGADVAVDGGTIFYSVVASQFDARDGMIVSVPKACDGDDLDGDGVPNVEDNCPAVANPGQEDGDLDGAGDPCDDCPNHPDPEQEDLCS